MPTESNGLQVVGLDAYLQYIRTFGNVALGCDGPCGSRDLYSGRHVLGSNSGC